MRPPAAALAQVMVKRVLRLISTYVTFALATGFFWGASEAVINRLWRPAAVWRPDSLLESAYGRVLFYSCLVLAAAGVTAAGIFVVRRLRRGRGATERVWPGAAAAAAVIISSLGWFFAGRAPRGKMHLARFAFDLTEVKPFFIYWGCLLVVAVLLAFVLCRFFARRRWWRAAGRFARAFGVVAFVAVVAGRFIERARRPVPRGPNVVIVILDAWRADAFREDLMPKLYKYAEDDATVFTRAWSCASWTLPSMASVFTGQYVDSHRGRSGPRADTVSPTLAQLFRAEGYETTAFVGNRLIDRHNPITDGFDTFTFWDWFPPLRAVGFYYTNWYGPAVRDTFGCPLVSETSRKLTRSFEQFLSRSHRRPYFLWVHYIDPHGPYTPPPGYYEPADEPYIRRPRYNVKKLGPAHHRLYEGECAFLDDLLAPTVLKKLMADDNTIVVFTADHGEEFWEHYAPGHGKSVYDYVTRVPLIISVPGKSPAVVTTPVSLVDLAPTLLTLTGLAVPPTMQGEPLPWKTDGSVGRPIFIGSNFTKNMLPSGRQDAIIVWPRKLIVPHDDMRMLGEYYDLARDPGEENALEGDDVEVLLRRQLKAWKRATRRRRTPASRDDYNAAAADLRALGYIR